MKAAGAGDKQNNSKKWNDKKMVASSYFIFALSLLVCTLSLPFTKNFSELEFFVFGFGVIVIDYGLLLLINPYRRLTLFNWKLIGAPKLNMYNIGGGTHLGFLSFSLKISR